jgi:hypothetical protein
VFTPGVTLTEFPVTVPIPLSMLTLCAPVTDHVSEVVPSLVIFEGEAAKLAIVGRGGGAGGVGVGVVVGGEVDGLVGSPALPPQPSTATAMIVLKSALLMDSFPG